MELGIILFQGLRAALFLMSEVPLYRSFSLAQGHPFPTHPGVRVCSRPRRCWYQVSHFGEGLVETFAATNTLRYILLHQV